MIDILERDVEQILEQSLSIGEQVIKTIISKTRERIIGPLYQTVLMNWIFENSDTQSSFLSEYLGVKKYATDVCGTYCTEKQAAHLFYCIAKKVMDSDYYIDRLLWIYLHEETCARNEIYKRLYGDAELQDL